MKWFLDKFDLPSNAETIDQITENLRHALSSRYGITFTRRMVENVLCKVFRNRTGSISDRLFWDLAFNGQMLFKCEGDGLRVFFPSHGEPEDTLIENFLIKKWAFGKTNLSVEEIIGKLGMSESGVPTLLETVNWTVSDDLMFGRARTKVDFELSHRVAVSCTGFLLHNLGKIANGLRN
jgi:hypothetical protein